MGRRNTAISPGKKLKNHAKKASNLWALRVSGELGNYRLLCTMSPVRHFPSIAV